MLSFVPASDPIGHDRDPFSRRVHLRSRRARARCAWFLALAALSACKREEPQGSTAEVERGEQVLLRGSFRAVTKPASGNAEIVRKGEVYELVLTRVSVQAKGPVHVYLVGLPEATSTAAVDEVELKYDMAELVPNLPEQRIELPSEPNPELRSVVLWDPKYAANLASAPLTPNK